MIVNNLTSFRLIMCIYYKLTLLSFQSSHCQFLPKRTNRCYCQKRFQPKHWYKWWKVVHVTKTPTKLNNVTRRFLPWKLGFPHFCSPASFHPSETVRGKAVRIPPNWWSNLSHQFKRASSNYSKVASIEDAWECSPWTIVYISYHFINYCLYFAGAKYIPI